MSGFVVYDLEQGVNIHVGCFLCIRTKEMFRFVIHPSRNDIIKYQEFLRSLKGMIGYNNIAYDSHLIDKILQIDSSLSANKINNILYKLSQSVIENRKDNYNPSIFQRDLFRIHHFDNKNKAVSLKQYQAFIGWKTVMDINFDWTKSVSEKEIPDIIYYCDNDVYSTANLWFNSKNQIKMRSILSKEYGFDMMNYNDPKIGEQILLDQYCKLTGKDKWEVKQLRTEREYIHLKECVQDTIHLNKLSKVYNKFAKTTLYLNQNSKFHFTHVFSNIVLDYGLGGIHGANKGVYKETDNNTILDIDVASMYPSIAIEYNLYPEHLGKEFVTVYREIRDKRFKSKKLRKDKSLSDADRDYHNAINDGLKLSLNGSYGKSKDKYSFLFDPKFTFSITISGQLFITMLIEQLSVIPNIYFIQANTDGITIDVRNEYLDQVYNICKLWEEKTHLVLEYIKFKKLYMRDVNNFLAVDEWNNIKSKGAYEVDKKVGASYAYHKNNSFRIIPLAVQEYFLNNTPVEHTIKSNKNINNFLGFLKMRKNSKGERFYITSTKYNGTDIEVDEYKDKIFRYYLSTDGEIYKKVSSSSEAFIHVHPTNKKFNRHYKQTMAMELLNKFPKNIDYSFYIYEAKKLIDSITPLVKQQSLF